MHNVTKSTADADLGQISTAHTLMLAEVPAGVRLCHVLQRSPRRVGRKQREALPRRPRPHSEQAVLARVSDQLGAGRRRVFSWTARTPPAHFSELYA